MIYIAICPIFYFLSTFLIWGYLGTLGKKEVAFSKVLTNYGLMISLLTIIMAIIFIVLTITIPDPFDFNNSEPGY